VRHTEGGRHASAELLTAAGRSRRSEWLLSLPCRLRHQLPWNHDMSREFVALFVRAVRARDDGVADGRGGRGRCKPRVRRSSQTQRKAERARVGRRPRKGPCRCLESTEQDYLDRGLALDFAVLSILMRRCFRIYFSLLR
jgi:hypothetical protein